MMSRLSRNHNSKPERRKSYLSERLKDLRRAQYPKALDAPFDEDGLPYSGLTNEGAARVCGFWDRLSWAAAKKELGLQPVLTRAGKRYVLNAELVKRARAIAAAAKRRATHFSP